MKNTTKTSLSGLTIMFFIFLTLKLAEIGVVKDWSWLAVTSPIWIPLAIGFGFVCVFMPFYIFLKSKSRDAKKTEEKILEDAEIDYNERLREMARRRGIIK